MVRLKATAEGNMPDQESPDYWNDMDAEDFEEAWSRAEPAESDSWPSTYVDEGSDGDEAIEVPRETAEDDSDLAVADSELPISVDAWLLDTSGYYSYLTLDCTDMEVRQVAATLKTKGLPVLRFAKSLRRAGDGRQYQFYIRLNSRRDDGVPITRDDVSRIVQVRVDTRSRGKFSERTAGQVPPDRHRSVPRDREAIQEHPRMVGELLPPGCRWRRAGPVVLAGDEQR